MQTRKVIIASVKRIYLDYAATTPLDTLAAEAMQPFYREQFANPSSVHAFGQQAENALENAREKIARLLNAQPDEVIFTSGGTESDNLAIRGAAFEARRLRGADHILISPVEHHAVSMTAEQLAAHFNFKLEFLPVDAHGRVDPAEVKKRLRPETAVVSVIMANNEIGTINPVAEIASACHENGVPFHTDAVQAGAHLRLDVGSLGIDLLSLGAHKFYGPKGVGVLYVRRGTPLLPVQTGGGQERGFRAGTSNIPYIVGMAAAFEVAQQGHPEHRERIAPLRDHLIHEVLENIPDSQLTGHLSERLPNHASFAFRGVDGNNLLMMLDVSGFACSSGSACKTGNPEPSEVLTALGLDHSWALGSLRVTLGRQTTEAEVADFLDALPELVETARQYA